MPSGISPVSSVTQQQNFMDVAHHRFDAVARMRELGGFVPGGGLLDWCTRFKTTRYIGASSIGMGRTNGRSFGGVVCGGELQPSTGVWSLAYGETGSGVICWRLAVVEIRTPSELRRNNAPLGPRS